MGEDEEGLLKSVKSVFVNRHIIRFVSLMKRGQCRTIAGWDREPPFRCDCAALTPSQGADEGVLAPLATFTIAFS